jgi:cyclophilin family peptidyl-prolyl cis-trans isomerase
MRIAHPGLTICLNLYQPLSESNFAMSTATSVMMKTSKGDLTIELDAQSAPKTVENFLNYARAGHYDGTIFHRVIANFMIQGGGFTPDMKQKGTNPPIVNESSNGLSNKKYTIAMARTSIPDSATSQFFINVTDNDFLDKANSRDRVGYCVFGKVTSGTDVVEAIKAVPTTTKNGHGDVPVETVLIESVQIIQHGQ